MSDGWISVKEQKPDAGKPVLVGISGKTAVLRAAYAPRLTLKESVWGEFQPQGEYDEATDDTYWPEGWYEWNAFEETHWRMHPEPTHWRELPAPPVTDQARRHGRDGEPRKDER